jgi:hypothetical protein
MTTANLDHNATLKASASAALSPLGLTQVGRSRTWLDDRGWYLINVEFQPSSGAKGSYLNVGAMWLWHEQDYVSFDYGYRIAPFEPADAAWAERAHRLSDLAAQRVLELRLELPDVRGAARLLRKTKPLADWHLFHAAVATGLAGDRKTARTMMDRLLAEDAQRDWERTMHTEMRGCRDLLGHPDAYRARVTETIDRTRERLRLPPPRLSPFF